MDFIEVWFHLSPDGGSGLVEALYIVGVVLVAALIVAVRRRGPASVDSGGDQDDHSGTRP
jgi:hypothetical protein